MDLQTALLLAQDGIVSGAVYALLALAMVLVFATTRILMVAQGEFVTFAGLSLGSFQLGVTPGIVWVLGVLALGALVMELVDAARRRRVGGWGRVVLVQLLLPAILIGLTVWLGPRKPPLAVQIVLSVLLVTAMGPLLYRVTFQPVAAASIRVLFVVAIALHFVLQGVGLLLFGAEGYRTDPMLDLEIPVGSILVTGQTILVLGVLMSALAAIWLFFRFTLLGKALRATAVNRIGARLVGIRTPLAGQLAFTLAAFVGGVSGVLFVGLTTIYYDSGFLIGLKAVLGAVCGAMVSYPVAILGAFGVGILESFAAFLDSALTEATVFAALIPVLLWLSFSAPAREEGEEI